MAELCQKLVEVTSACNVLGYQIKKVPQLEAKVANLKHANSVQLKIHQANVESHQVEIQHLTMQLEGKDVFCDVEKSHVLVELQAYY